MRVWPPPHGWVRSLPADGDRRGRLVLGAAKSRASSICSLGPSRLIAPRRLSTVRGISMSGLTATVSHGWPMRVSLLRTYAIRASSASSGPALAADVGPPALPAPRGPLGLSARGDDGTLDAGVGLGDVFVLELVDHATGRPAAELRRRAKVDSPRDAPPSVGGRA
jgi:hypothetical protein